MSGERFMRGSGAHRGAVSRSPVIDGLLLGIFGLVIVTLAVKYFIFNQLDEAMSRQVVVTIAPVQWHMEARCAQCGHTWTIEGGSR